MAGGSLSCDTALWCPVEVICEGVKCGELLSGVEATKVRLDGTDGSGPHDKAVNLEPCRSLPNTNIFESLPLDTSYRPLVETASQLLAFWSTAKWDWLTTRIQITLTTSQQQLPRPSLQTRRRSQPFRKSSTDLMPAKSASTCQRLPRMKLLAMMQTPMAARARQKEPVLVGGHSAASTLFFLPPRGQVWLLVWERGKVV